MELKVGDMVVNETFGIPRISVITSLDSTRQSNSYEVGKTVRKGEIAWKSGVWKRHQVRLANNKEVYEYEQLVGE